MWMLSFISDDILHWIIHGIVISAIIIYVIAFFSGPYRAIVSTTAIILGLFGVYLEGGYFAEKEWRDRVAALGVKIKIAEEKSSVVNTIIKTQLVEKIKIIKEKTDANIQYIDRIVTQYDNICTLSNAAIVLHNNASQNSVSPSPGVPVEGTSDVKASSLLTTVTENYGTYYQTRDQVIGWQLWYNEQKKIFENIK